MHAGRYRTGFALNLLILALLLFFFSKTFLLQALVILAALALALFLMLRADARQLKLEVQVPPSSLTGAPLPATLRVNCERRLRPEEASGSGKASSCPARQSRSAALPEITEMPSPPATRFLTLSWSLSRAVTQRLAMSSPAVCKNASMHF